MTIASYKDEAYHIIKEKIIRLELLPGEKISRKQFVSMLDIGDTPVREAILQLKREGLLVIRPQSGTFISKINMQQVREAKFVREKLESAIVVEAVGIIDDAQIESLRQIVEMQEIYLKNGNSEKFFELDEEFHQFFYLVTDKTHVYTWLLDLNVHLNRYRHLTLKVKDFDWMNILQQHWDIYEALKAKDADLIAKLVSRHLDLVDENYEAVYGEFHEYFD